MFHMPFSWSQTREQKTNRPNRTGQRVFHRRARIHGAWRVAFVNMGGLDAIYWPPDGATVLPVVYAVRLLALLPTFAFNYRSVSINRHLSSHWDAFDLVSFVTPTVTVRVWHAYSCTLSRIQTRIRPRACAVTWLIKKDGKLKASLLTNGLRIFVQLGQPINEQSGMRHAEKTRKLKCRRCMFTARHARPKPFRSVSWIRKK